jgi:hypothetical protein
MGREGEGEGLREVRRGVSVAAWVGCAGEGEGCIGRQRQAEAGRGRQAGMDRRQQQSELRSHHSLLRPVRAFPYFSESEGRRRRLRAVSYPGTVASSLPGWPGGSAADATPLCRRHSDRPCCHDAVSFDDSDGVSKHHDRSSGSCQRLRVDQARAIIRGGHRQLIGRAAARWPCRPV